MFILYQNDECVLYYENKNYDSGLTHSLTAKNLRDFETHGMWIDPTDSQTSNTLEAILRLKALKENGGSEDYNHELACVIENLIENRGMSSLKMSCLARDILRHHKQPQSLYDTINMVSSNMVSSFIHEKYDNSAGLSCLRKENDLRDVAELRTLATELVNTLKEFIANLLGIEITTEPECSSNCVTPSII